MEIGSSNRKDMGAPQPWQDASVKNHPEIGYRRTKPEGTLSVALSAKHRRFFKLLPRITRELFDEMNVGDSQGQPTKKRKLLCELNGTAQGSSSIGEIDDLKPKWTVFRMLVPAMDDDVNNQHKRYIKAHFDRKGEIDFYFAAGVGIVMISVKRDPTRPRSSIDRAAYYLKDVHQYFLQTISFECLTRLLVPAAHAKGLIILNRFNSRPWRLAIYLTDNMSVFFPGDVIVDVDVDFPFPVDVLNNMQAVVSDLGQLAVHDGMMSKFKFGNNIRPSYRGISASGKSSSIVKPQRKYAIREFRRIPLSYIDHIIGEDGENLEKIWKSSAASVYLETTTTVEEVVITIVGETYEEVKAAKNVMEVTVLAKRDPTLPRCSIDHATDVLKEVHRYFLRTVSFKCLTRLLVPAAHAKALIILNKINCHRLRLAIYLTDNMSVFFPGDVIVDVDMDFPYLVNVLNNMEAVVSDLGELAVDDGMISKFKSGNNIRPSYREVSAPGKSSLIVKPQRKYAIRQYRKIPLSYIDHIIGEDGANLEKIWKSSAASVYLETTETDKAVFIYIVGETYEEVMAAREVMEELIPDDVKKDEKDGLVFGRLSEFEDEEWDSHDDDDDAHSPRI